MKTWTSSLLLLLCLLSCKPSETPESTPAARVQTNNSYSNNPPECDCCVFDEMPANAGPVLTIPDSSTTQRMKITGTVYQSDGKTPAPGVAMYMYHTDETGHYTKRGDEDRSSHAWWHGFHRGWLRTDAQGRYEINTIRPAPYPNATEPAHIHCLVSSAAQRECYFIADFVFTDDPFLKPSFWENTKRGWRLQGINADPNYGGVKLTTNAQGVAEGTRDIVLLEEFD